MMKKLSLILLLVAFTVSTALASEGGNPKKGKYLFKKNCKACHTEGAEGGVLTPMAKTMSQWDRFFKKEKHEGTILQDLKEKDRLDINQYLYDHAADSDQPETCG